MAYSVAADVKTVLQIASGVLTYDTEITACIVSADALIDKFLAKADLSVPSPVPQTIEDASIHFAAWLFRHRRDPANADVFWSEAMKFLDAYIETEAEVALNVVNNE